MRLAASMVVVFAAAAQAAPKRALFLTRLTSARGDRDIEDLFRSALADTGKFTLVSSRKNAALVGRLSIDRYNGGTELDLEIVSQQGEPVAHPHRFVREKESIVDGAIAMAAEAAGDRAPPPAVVSAPAPAASRPAEETEVEDWRSPWNKKRFDFLFGLDLGIGPWSADPAKIIGGSDSGFDFANYAPAFTRTIDGRWHPSLGLRAGWTFLGAGAFELNWNASRWAGSGSATLIGARLTAYILQPFWPEHWFDLGVEFGAGYALLAGSGYDMTGGYWNLGLSAEYPLNHWMGAMIYYRLFAPFLKHFYTDYASGLNEPTSGVTFSWNTFGAGIVVHPSLKL